MGDLYHIINETEINIQTIFFRLLISFVVGAIVGFEREHHKQPAGLRTHILICMGSTLIMLLSIFIPQTFQNFQNGDPGRIAAQVVSGIGFLGAGAIMKFGVNVRGLTTAASIWVMAAMGLAIGAGMYWGVLAGTLLILFVLTVLDMLEKWAFPAKYIKKLHIYTEQPLVTSAQLVPSIKKHGITIRTIDMEQSFEGQFITYRMTIQISEKVDLNALNMDLGSINGVKRVKLQQLI
ncbi:MAG: MgtC/SapB family protein [Marinifilaceae bacterium]|jgi:putative Mg2+ transporter-C (MgtC) family protein